LLPLGRRAQFQKEPILSGILGDRREAGPSGEFLDMGQALTSRWPRPIIPGISD